ncbi:hypothetical protein GCM10011415_01890 [Salipiger pallidus]|uniref:Uncharacterized protein n=1 Tax=Salipiger pallidus TaxID=1775170 RepID=A0A8J2ZGE9_9RHOB|nr:hypothetical protein [Salipiger pallidus]GGG59618.1 hypothetical protein GCM10011415_01890 [Salipiger pallidus]
MPEGFTCFYDGGTMIAVTRETRGVNDTMVFVWGKDGTGAAKRALDPWLAHNR